MTMFARMSIYLSSLFTTSSLNLVGCCCPLSRERRSREQRVVANSNDNVITCDEPFKANNTRPRSQITILTSISECQLQSDGISNLRRARSNTSLRIFPDAKIDEELNDSSNHNNLKPIRMNQRKKFLRRSKSTNNIERKASLSFIESQDNGIISKEIEMIECSPKLSRRKNVNADVFVKSLDENSFRVSPRRLRGRNDGNLKGGVPQISVSDYSESFSRGSLSLASSGGESSEKPSGGDEDVERAFVTYHHSRSQTSLSSFGARSESMSSVYSAAGGGRYGAVAVTGEALFSISYNYKAGAMEVYIKECRNLAPVKHNRSDPYVKVYLLPDRTKSGKRKTKVKKHTLNPTFDEVLKFYMTISEIETRTLWLSVWHSDIFGRNDFLGEVTLPLGHEVFENPGLKWYPLQERLEASENGLSYKGDIFLALKYVPADVTLRRSAKKPGSSSANKGELHVLVKEAHNLMATRSNGTSDPFCKSYLLPDKAKSGKQKTPVIKKSCNPKWNHTFVYEDVSLNDLRDRCLELTIWDYDKITSNDFLGGVRLSLGIEQYQGREVDWMDSVGDEIILYQQMLDRPNMWVYGELRLRSSMQTRSS